jgi:Tol biopolymer transport system component
MTPSRHGRVLARGAASVLRSLSCRGSTMTAIRPHRHSMVAAALALAGGLWPTVANSGALPDGLIDAAIIHRGYEQIVAGPNVAPGFGLTTELPYRAADVAISGDGQRLWFVMYHEFATPRHQVWSMFADGSGAQQSNLTAAVNTAFGGAAQNGLFVRTSRNGNVAMFESKGQYWRISAPGGPLSLMFDLGLSRLSEGQMRVSDDGSLGLFLERANLQVSKVDLTALAPEPTALGTAAFFSYMGLDPRTMFGFDASADGEHWYVSAENYFSNISRNRYWINRVSGLVGPSRAVEDIGSDHQWVNAHVQVSDDGLLFGYCVNPETSGPNARCYLQEPGSSSRVALTDGNRFVSRMVLADNGSRVYLVSDANSSAAYGYFQSSDGVHRRFPGSQRLNGTAFVRPQLSDDGRVVAAPYPINVIGPASMGVYVLHDGVPAPTGFPRIERILHRYDADSDRWIVRALVHAPDGIERLFTLPLYQGLEPSRYLADAENPLFAERFGGGGSWSTVLTADPDNPGWYERRIALGGKRRFMTRDFDLRLVLVDHTGHRTAFYDFTPLAAHPEQQVELLSTDANASSRRPMSDAAGHYVVFESDADNLLDDGGGPGIFRRDTRNGRIERVSVDDLDVPISGAPREPSISADGQRIVFVAPLAAPGALRGESSQAKAARTAKTTGWGIFLRNMLTGSAATTLLGNANSGGSDTLPRIAPGGEVLVFASDTPPTGGPSPLSQIYHVPIGADLLPRSDELRCLSCKALDVGSGAELGADSNGAARHPVLSADGQTVAWETSASNATNAAGSCPDASSQLVLRNLLAGTVRAPGSPPDPADCNSGGSRAPQLDHSGRRLVYESEQPVKPGDSNGLPDVYLFDAAGGADLRISEGPGGAQANAPALQPAISGDGRVIGFVSAASTLDGSAPPAPGQTELFVRERTRSTLLRLAKRSDGGAADGAGSAPALSYSGGDLVFESSASNLVGGVPAVEFNVFRRTNPLAAGRVFADGFD